MIPVATGKAYTAYMTYVCVGFVPERIDILIQQILSLSSK